ncbi:unnamed protein product, partial [Discosporangium mesarthrocarpum]
LAPTGGATDLRRHKSSPGPGPAAARKAGASGSSPSMALIPVESVRKAGTSRSSRPLALVPVESPTTTPRYKKVFDESTGRNYWYNVETKETYWKNPERIENIPLPSEGDPRKRRKTYGHPPTGVQAIGQNQEALVWWEELQDMDPAIRVVGFVVNRYRLDGREWHRKGLTLAEGAQTTSTKVGDLQNDLLYRFTVSTRTEEGLSEESAPSRTVRPNTPLPEGWKEIFNPSTGKMLYKNIKTNQACLSRPETNPYVIPTDLFLHFSQEETDTMCREFKHKAELSGGTWVSPMDVFDMLPNLGEKLTVKEVVQRLEKQGWSPKGDVREANVTYSQFVGLLWSVKEERMAHKSLCQRVTDFVMERVTSKRISAKKLALIEQDTGRRLGAWEKINHPVTGKPCYCNTENGQTSWTMPTEVKFYLSNELKVDLLKTFTEDELFDMRKEFNKMDLDGSGTIDANELALILKSYGEAVPKSRLKALFNEVDHDGSGEIEFSEFVLMVQAVKKGNATRSWGRIN